MEKVLEQDLKDWESASIPEEIVEELSEGPYDVGEIIINTAIEMGDYHGAFSELRESLSGLGNFFRGLYKDQRKHYYRNAWGYQPKRIPPKVTVCSSRHRGRKCKKIRK